jgi:hypothetical protein
LKRYEDPTDEGNSAKYHTGKLCIEGYGRPAGTYWSPYWCQECNAKRINDISEKLNEIEARYLRREGEMR